MDVDDDVHDEATHDEAPIGIAKRTSANPQKTCHNLSIVFQAWLHLLLSLIFIVVLLDFWACFTFENPE